MSDSHWRANGTQHMIPDTLLSLNLKISSIASQL